MNLKDKVVILTGAARVGVSVARDLAMRGASIALTYLESEKEVEGARREAEKQGARVTLFKADLSRSVDVAQLVESVKKEFGKIDILIHMAAIYPTTPWETLSEADWNQNMDIIAKSTFLLGKAMGDEFLKNKGMPIVVEGKNVGSVQGKIITISDWSALERPYKDHLPYNAAKAAVVGLTKSFAKELAPTILVNAVAPGPILAPPNLTEEENREVVSGTPLGHWGGADEIAKAILYLLDADFVTGEVLAVDGGRSIA